MNNLLKVDAQKIPGLVVIDSLKKSIKDPKNSYHYGSKRKSTLQYIARLCDRGDMMSTDTPLLYSSHTASRVSPRVILAIAVSLSMTIGMVDTTSAFTQSHLVEKKKEKDLRSYHPSISPAL